MIKTKPERGRALRGVLTALILAASLAAFVYWGFTEKGLTIPGAAVAAVTLCLFALGLVLCLPGAFRFFSGEQPVVRSAASGDRSGTRRRLHPVVGVMLTLLAARVILIAVAYVFGRIFSDVHGSVFSSLKDIWLKLDTDAPHYFSIAENGYVTSGDDMYSLVFLPLFPALIRAFNLVFNDSFTSAFVINTICSCGAAAVLYELALVDVGRRTARLAVVFAFALPAAIFYAAPMSEALFLLLTASAMLALRRERFLLAGLLGGLAAFTRSPGIILIVPYAAEAAACAVRKRRAGGTGAWFWVSIVLGALLLLSGSFGYLLINRLVFGDWFKFVEFQREIWYQQPAFFFDTAALQTDMFFSTVGAANDEALGLWLPNLLYIGGALLVFTLSARTLRTSYVLYFAAYFAVVCGASWLLSAPRYLTALVALPLALAHLCDSRDDGVALGRARAKAAIAVSLLLLGQVAYIIMYTADYCIY